MDTGLRFADEYLLDKVWATVFPSSLLLPSGPLLKSSSNLTQVATTSEIPTILSSTKSLLRSLATYGSYPSHSPNPLHHEIWSDPASAPYQSLSLFPRDSIARQSISLWVIALIGAGLLYFIVSSLSYYYLFDRRLEHHPRFLENQVRKEIALSVKAMPWIDAMIVPWWVAEVRGHTLLYSSFYDSYGTGPKWSAVLGGVLGFSEQAIKSYGPYIHLATTCLAFLAFTDYCIYWIHRWLHIPFLYKRLHKPHHRWLVPTPFAALAFHPLDGYAQSLPYHFIVCFMPMNKFVYLGLFVGINCWTIFIHDGDMISGHFLEKWINSPAHHTLHHLYFTCNYGQYFTIADSWGGSYRAPRPDLDPIHDALKNFERKRLLAEREERKAVVAQAKAAGLTEIPGADEVEASDSGYEGSEKEYEVDLLEVKEKGDVVDVKRPEVKGSTGKSGLTKEKVEVFTESFRKYEPGTEILRRRR